MWLLEVDSVFCLTMYSPSSPQMLWFECVSQSLCLECKPQISIWMVFEDGEMGGVVIGMYWSP